MVGAAAVISSTSALARNGVVIADAPSHTDDAAGSSANLRVDEVRLMPVLHSVALASGHLDAEPQVDTASSQSSAAASVATTPAPTPVAQLGRW